MLRLASMRGLVPGRCRSTNQCDYCARLSAVEWSEMLALDALDGNAPCVWMVLTTRTATVDTARFYKARELLMRAIKRRWPDAEYLCIVEFTTGYGPRSGGRRRPHWNVLLKNVPADAIPELDAIVASVWCVHVDAKPAAQFVGGIGEAGGLMRYIALHFLKESQMPPKGWHGHRVTRSRGYFTDEGWKLRRRAQRSLRVKRQLRKVEALGLEGEVALLNAERLADEDEAVRWELVKLAVNSDTGEVISSRLLDNREPHTMRMSSTVRTRRVGWAFDFVEYRELRPEDAGGDAGRDPAPPPRDQERTRSTESRLEDAQLSIG